MRDARADAPAAVGWTVIAASFGFALIQLDVTIVNVALPRMGQALRTDVAGLQWVVDAYALVFAALLLGAGSLGDRFGARRVYGIGVLAFAAGSVACGLAPSAGWLIAGRAVQGLGAAAMLPCSLALLNHATGHDPRLRARAVGWWTAAGGIAIAAGPLAGGVLLSFAGWRSIFLVNLPVCAAAGLLALRVEETRPKPDGRGLDPLGQALGVLAIGGVTAAVIEARPLGWTAAPVLAAAAIGAASAAAFVANEARTPRPMLPLGLFRQRGFGAAVGYGVIANLTYYGVIFVLSLYLQRAMGYGPLKAGLAYLPLTATLFFVNVVSGWWVGRAGSRTPMTVGALIDVAGFVLLASLGVAGGYAALLPAFLVIPAGMGLGVPAMTTAVLASAGQARSGLASGVLNAARQAGGAMGVALFGALAGGGPAQIGPGLRVCAIIAAALLAVAATLARLGVPGGRPQAAR
jgi:DHA2 family methylenomycin A resistance protein-like MFS transporter